MNPGIQEKVGKNDWWLAALLLALLYFPLFSHLDSLPIRIWDEARLAKNALHMYNTGELIVTYFDGAPDLYNTKPPLLIWLMAGLMKIFGPTELAVRLPSAIAALLTAASLVWFSIRYLQNKWIGFTTALSLVLLNGFADFHTARTGDYDSLLTLFLTLYCLCFFIFIETGKQKHLYFFFIFLTLAVLTKGVAGLLLLPAVFLFALYRKKFQDVLKNKATYIGSFIFLIFVFGYYFIREQKAPGYLDAVFENELGGRYLKVLENHEAGFWFYLKEFITIQTSLLYLTIPSGIIISLFNRNILIKRAGIFFLLALATYFLVISTGKTKLTWYYMPMFPFGALFAGIFITLMFEFLSEVDFFERKLTFNIAPYLFLLLLFGNPYRAIFYYTNYPTAVEGDLKSYGAGFYLKEAREGKRDLDGHFILHSDYNAHYTFYTDILAERGMKISFKNIHEVQPGDLLLIQKPLSENLLTHFDTTNVAVNPHGQIVRVKEKSIEERGKQLMPK